MQPNFRCIQHGMIVAGTLFLSGCSDWVESISNPQNRKSVTVALPVDWTLTDTEGRTLDATIIGRESSSLTIVRRSDGKRFDLPFDRLSLHDRERAAMLSFKTVPPEPTGVLKLRRASLADLDEEIRVTMIELETTDSPMKYKSLVSALARLNTERSKLAAEIAELERP